jgi:hypothetical protein
MRDTTQVVTEEEEDLDEEREKKVERLLRSIQKRKQGIRPTKVL